jgi:hypothetical protein
MLDGALVRTLTVAAAIAVCALPPGCASHPPPPPASLLVGVSQQGGMSLGRADGEPLLSEAYLVARDGRVRIMENYGDAPAERVARTSPASARKLIELLSSPAWQQLSSEPSGPARGDEVRVTIETEGKSVTRSSSAQEPIFREVLGKLVEIRRGGG